MIFYTSNGSKSKYKKKVFLNCLTTYTKQKKLISSTASWDEITVGRFVGSQFSPLRQLISGQKFDSMSSSRI